MLAIVGSAATLLLIGLLARLALTSVNTPQVAVGLELAAAVFLVLLGAYVAAYMRNATLFVSNGTFGRRDFLGRIRTWPTLELAEVRFQRIDWGGSVPRLAYLFITREHQLLFRLEPNLGWKEEDIRRLAARLGVAVKEAPPVKLKEFRQEFPNVVPAWMASPRLRLLVWIVFFILTMLALPVVLAITLPRLS